MAHLQSPSYSAASTNHLGTFETHLTISVYAFAWVLMWLVGTMLEFVIFVVTSVAKGHAIDRKYFEVSLYMPVFAWFLLGMWFSVKCIEWSIGFLCSLASEDTEKSNDEEPVLRRRRGLGCRTEPSLLPIPVSRQDAT